MFPRKLADSVMLSPILLNTADRSPIAAPAARTVPTCCCVAVSRSGMNARHAAPAVDAYHGCAALHERTALGGRVALHGWLARDVVVCKRRVDGRVWSGLPSGGVGGEDVSRGAPLSAVSVIGCASDTRPRRRRSSWVPNMRARRGRLVGGAKRVPGGGVEVPCANERHAIHVLHP